MQSLRIKSRGSHTISNCFQPTTHISIVMEICVLLTKNLPRHQKVSQHTVLYLQCAQAPEVHTYIRNRPEYMRRLFTSTSFFCIYLFTRFDVRADVQRSIIICVAACILALILDYASIVCLAPLAQ